MKKNIHIWAQAALLAWLLAGCQTWQKPPKAEYWLLNPDFGQEGQPAYLHPETRQAATHKEYMHCFTDTFRHMAFVVMPLEGMVAIDRNEEIMYHVFIYDNGPDPLSEGLFRIVDQGLIGYANAQGQVVIPPRYTCAFPFQQGQAKVAYQCKKKENGEYTRWTSNSWFYIDKQGHRIDE